ncbi:MAG TPA: CarD family transcriptional regulator [Rubrobacteraceae bacterium]|nr:CarD family transcriptional regulator [Rubrobacteraceae bacterium]
MSETEETMAKDGTMESNGNDDGANQGTSAGTSFVEGDLVVYPSHGAGCISGVEEKTILGEVRRYYVVYLPDTELTVSIPAEGETGLRACADEQGVSEALAVLGGDTTQMPPNWNHRLKHNKEKIRSGELPQVAEVVRNLHVYGGEHGLSTGERNMLMKARQILSSEFALSRNIDVTEAERLVDEALKDGAR